MPSDVRPLRARNPIPERLTPLETPMSDTIEIARPQTDLRLRPLTPLLGAEVWGVDLSRPLDQPTVRRIRQALLDHKVLVFREQAIDDAQQIAFTRTFGRVTP